MTHGHQVTGGHIEDRRGSSSGGLARFRWGSAACFVLLVLSWFTGIDFLP